MNPTGLLALVALAAPQDSTVESGRWAGAYGGFEGHGGIWDPITVDLRVVEGDRLGGTLRDTRGRVGELAGAVEAGTVRFELELDGDRLEFEGTVAGSLLRGTCVENGEPGTFLAVHERVPEDEELLGCAGLYRTESGDTIWIRKSLHLIFDDFGSGRRRILYAVERDRFVAGEGFALTDPPAFQVGFERGDDGIAHRLVVTEGDGAVATAERCCPYREEPFEFELEEGVTIRGALTLPEGEGPHPAVVWVHGSGRARRVGAGSWPAFFASLGFATLAVDKRGVGESTGTYELPDGGHDNEPHMARRAGDVRATVAALCAHPRIDADQVGLCGASQAGWVIPQASGTGDVAFAITLSGGATPLSVEGVYSQLGDEMGASASSLDFDELYRRTRRHRPRDHDFRPDFAAMKCPGLWLYGLKDRSNPSILCAELLDEVAAEHDMDFTVVRCPDANHSLLVCRHGGAAEARGLGTRAPDMFRTVSRWLEERDIGPR